MGEIPLNPEITCFAETTFRGQRKRFGIKQRDRSKHMYVIGKTGMGKSTLLENMTIQDIMAGHGVAVVDPHGEYAERILDFIPGNRVNDVIYFNPADTSYPVAFNIMEKVEEDQRHLISSGLLGVFKKIWPDVWSPRMEYLLANAILALLEIPGSTLLGVNRMFGEKDFRKRIVAQLHDPVIKSFWENEFAKYPEQFMREAVAAIQNKVGQFSSNPLIRNIIGQVQSAVDMRSVMDESKIFIVNLAKGKIGEENSRLLGAMIVTKLYLTAMTRVDMPEEERRDFYLYVDEFQNFATESFANILSEARKYHLNLTVAHQYIMQMEEMVQHAVFGNVGTMVIFRVGAEDAEVLEKEFMPEFVVQDLCNLGFKQIYVKLMIDGITSRPFSAETLAPFPLPNESHRDTIVRVSRERYGTSRAVVEEKIRRFALGSGESLPLGNLPIGAALVPSTPAGDSRTKAERELYEARCPLDGRIVMVPFKPDGLRPVYCEEHMNMIKFRSKASRAVPLPEGEEERTKRENPSLRNPGAISLAVLRRPRPERVELKDREPAKKSGHLAELRQALEESLRDRAFGRQPAERKLAESHPQPQTRREEVKEEKTVLRSGVLQPGETIKFE